MQALLGVQGSQSIRGMGRHTPRRGCSVALCSCYLESKIHSQGSETSSVSLGLQGAPPPPRGSQDSAVVTENN